VGRTKGAEVGEIGRRDGREFDCATWPNKARSLRKDQFKQEVGKELAGAEKGTVGDHLLQALQKPDSHGRAGD
jgi:hypothetical protein